MAGPGRRLPALTGPPSGAASKWDIREKVWAHLEASGLAEFPRPVHGRIPNFKGSLQACCSLRELDVFSRAREVKVDPDKPLEGARLAALQARKTLLVPTPRLRTGLFNRIVPPPGATKEVLRKCATSQAVRPGHVVRFGFAAWSLAALSCYNLTLYSRRLLPEKPGSFYTHLYLLGKPNWYRMKSPLMKKRCWQFVFTQCSANNPYHAAVKCPAGIIADRQPQITEPLGLVLCTEKGVKEYSVPVGLDGKAQVDLVVVGSVAVSEKGWRIGKGEGYADMEYAMMVSMGAVQEDTPVVTIVHDCQVLDIAEELLDDHDLTVDYILTPTRTIQTNCKRPKPQGIMWHKVSSEMLGKIPILKTLRSREKQAGKDVTLQDEHPALANTNRAALSNKKVMAANTQPQAAPGSAPVGQPHVESDPVNPRLEGSDTITTVYVGNLPASLSVSELKSALREFQVTPVRLSWQGAQHRAFLEYGDKGTADRAVSSLQGLSLGGNTLRVELAKSQRSKGQGEINSHK